MAKKTQSERVDDIQAGQMARLVHSEIQERAAMREGKIVDRLVMMFNGGKITNEVMLSGIAAIAELRKLVGDLERQIKQGLDAEHTEIAQAERYSEGDFLNGN